MDRPVRRAIPLPTKDLLLADGMIFRVLTLGARGV